MFLHTFMCSPVEGRRRTETSHFFYKIVGIKVSREYFLNICVIIFQHTGRIFIRFYALYIYIYINLHIYCQIFICSLCVLSSMLPLRSVGRSNFVMVCVNLTTLIQKRHILMRTAVLYIYIYIYIYIKNYRQYTTEEGHRSVRKVWSFYYRFIGLKCHNYALYLCFVYE